MFRSSKPKKNKRRRVAEDEEQNMSECSADDDVTAVSMSSNRRSINTFSTGGTKNIKNMVQTRQIISEREIVPQHYAGDATYEVQIDTERDRKTKCGLILSDARAIMERSIKANQDGSADAESGKVYRGQAAYKSYITKKESQVGMNKYTG
ncbi:hypothetical protein PsorP6_003524 [Peronosclerospora sorghi]|uniref:Uncharacterized protein n=1 Tax=Peronosclerospora sorghi TaxID=230839 RepID=A0ACC0VLJ5_9STRA|nr:hypothetical protein PsorP6_003524 [Peronosclerospora sorghi]